MNIFKPLKILQLKPVHNLLRNLTPALTASIPNILGHKNLLRPIENVPQYRSLTVAQSLQQAINSVPKLEDDSQINISKVAEYREVFKRSNSDSILDQCVKVAIEENISVPEVSVEITRVSDSTIKINKKFRVQFLGLRCCWIMCLQEIKRKRGAMCQSGRMKSCYESLK